MAGDEGFEPPIMGPEPTALPLGQSPVLSLIVNYCRQPTCVGSGPRDQVVQSCPPTNVGVRHYLTAWLIPNIPP